MTSGVDTNILVGEVTLDKILEGVDVVAVFDEVGDDLVGSTHGSVLSKVTAETAGVVTKTVRRRVLLDIGPLGVDGTKVHSPVLHGAALDTTSALAGLKLDVAAGDLTDASVIPSGDVLAVATNASLATIEKGRLRRVLGPPSPVVVGKVALVAALVAKELLVSIDVVAVPSEEVGLMRVSMIRSQMSLWNARRTVP